MSRKVLLLIAALVVLAIVVGVAVMWRGGVGPGDGGGDADGRATRAVEATLRVWIGGDKAYGALAEIGERFTEQTGVSVIVEHPEDVPGKFQEAAAAGAGPDILIWAHDRAGEWVGSGLIEPIRPSPGFQARYRDVGWEAFTFQDRLWGYPIALEAVGLIHNRALVPEAPGSFEAIFPLHEALARQGKRAILWDYNNPYFTWPLLAAKGGYVFGRTEGGGYDPGDVGVDTPGAIEGARMLVSLLASGVMPRGADYAVMEAEMVRGNLGMMISGPWAWKNLRRAGIDFGVAPIPSLDGEPGKPFIGVLGAMINRASNNKELAVEFLEHHVLTEAGLAAMNEEVPLGVPAHEAFYRELAEDPRIRGTMANVEQGVLMPSLPAMGRFWSAMTSALENIASGRQSPEDALAAAARRIRAG